MTLSQTKAGQPERLGKLETLLTHKDYWAVPARPVQRAKCRLFEGLPLGSELESDPDVIKMMGGDAKRRGPEGKRPFEVLDISAIRIGKSLFAGAFIFWLSQTVNLDQTIKSDIVNIFIVALKIDGCKAVLKHLLTPMLEKPALKRFLVDDPKDITLGGAVKNGLKIKHPSGKIIEVKCIPLDRAGGSGVSVFCAGVVVDEYPRMAGDGVKSVDDFRAAVLGRFLPGGMYLATGSPWQPFGPAYDLVEKHFGRESEEVTEGDIAVLRTSAESFLDRTPFWTEEKRKRLERKNPTAYKTDYLADFADGGITVFSATSIEAAWSRPPIPGRAARPALFADPSALRRDYWAVAVGGWVYPEENYEDIFVVEELGDTPTHGRGQVVAGRNGWVRILEDQYGRPIKRTDNAKPKPWFKIYDIKSWNKDTKATTSDLLKTVGDMGRQYGCTDFHFDGYEQLTLSEMIRREGLKPVVHSWSGKDRKTEVVDYLRTLFVEGRVELPKHPQLKNELLRMQAKTTPGGSYQYVVTGTGGHGDHASCLMIAGRADLDGFVDGSPTGLKKTRHEVYDYDDSDSIDVDFDDD